MGSSETRAPRAEVITLGCKVNQAESREIMAGLERCGYAVSVRWEHPDLTIINTCAVTVTSEAKGRKEIGRALRRGTRGLVVTGCMAEVSETSTAAIDGVDLLVPRRDKPRLLEMVRREFASRFQVERERGFNGLPANAAEEVKAKAFIKVQDGCGRHCSYCIVPRARGAPISLRSDEIKRQAAEAVDRGTGEVVLCGINLGGWRGTGGEGLSCLVEEVLGLGEGFRVRLSSMDLEDVSPELLDGLRRSKRLCPHFHLPLQSGSDEVLRRMGRGYATLDYSRRVEEIRSLWDGPAITTDVMVGFPGETEEDFAATLELVEKIRPSRLHVFRYSPRPGTEAAKMPGQVAEDRKRQRAAILAGAASELELAYAFSQAGKTLEVLAEEKKKHGDGLRAVGTTENYLKAALRGDGFEIGGLYRGRVTGTGGHGVIVTP